MSLITAEEKIALLKNLLSDPDDWISSEILRLNEENETAAAKRERSEASEPTKHIRSIEQFGRKNEQ